LHLEKINITVLSKANAENQMLANKFKGYVWPVTEAEGGLPLFYSSFKRLHNYEHNRTSRSPKKGDIIFFYSKKRLIGYAPVSISNRTITNSLYKSAMGLDFSHKQVFDPPIEIDNLVGVCSILNGKCKERYHNAFRFAVLPAGESRQVIKLAGRATGIIRQFTQEERSAWDEDLSPSYKRAAIPPRKQRRMVQVFERNQKLIADLKKEYDGICQICGLDHVIETDIGYYTEGHHIIPLGEKGYDSPKNVVNLCPFCHKRLHYSKDKDLLKEQVLYSEAHLKMIKVFTK
jgi:5-methylcytosine-specific restriction endonuclease McrA